jgi:hypothetical protein
MKPRRRVGEAFQISTTAWRIVSSVRFASAKDPLLDTRLTGLYMWSIPARNLTPVFQLITNQVRFQVLMAARGLMMEAASTPETWVNF